MDSKNIIDLAGQSRELRSLQIKYNNIELRVTQLEKEILKQEKKCPSILKHRITIEDKIIFRRCQSNINRFKNKLTKFNDILMDLLHTIKKQKLKIIIAISKLKRFSNSHYYDIRVGTKSKIINIYFGKKFPVLDKIHGHIIIINGILKYFRDYGKRNADSRVYKNIGDRDRLNVIDIMDPLFA